MALEGLFNMRDIKGIDRAFNGQEALDKLEINHKNPKCKSKLHKTYELIILDNNMPILTGVATAKKIKALQKIKEFSADLKLVLYSGDDFTGMQLS
jgi:CheY-like chemotaxis protein